MAQFVDSSEFRFNGFSSDMYSLSIVTRDSMDTERIFGVKKSIETQDGIGDTKLYIDEKRSTYSFPIEIMKLNIWNEVLPMSDKEYDNIIHWLMSGRENVGKLEVKGLIHYGKFTSATEFHNVYRQGIIKLEFESICPYAYSPIMTSVIRVSGEKIIELENKSNIDDKVYLDIHIEKIGSSGNVEILNLRDGNSFKVNDIAVGETIRVLGDGSREVESLTNKNRNMFKSIEYKDFPYINYGRNRVKIIGDCKIKIEYQLPIALR